jgi:hypothetical protein
MKRFIRVAYSYILSLIGLVLGMLFLAIALIVGLFGTWFILKTCLLELYEKDLVSLGSESISYLSKWIGVLVGMPFFGFLCAYWLKRSCVLNIFFGGRDEAKSKRDN